MTQLYLANEKKEILNFNEIQNYLAHKGIQLKRWQANFSLQESDSQETILKAYEHELGPYMEKHGFQSADVINVHPQTPNIEEIRAKFLREHTHTEDEVRFFVDGSGLFWFHFDNGEVVRLKCMKGDFLSVPKGYRHWFDLAPSYFVKAIRIFSNKEGWVAQYTESGIDARYHGPEPEIKMSLKEAERTGPSL